MLKAENGADGVALARQEKPDAVLMDIVMPGLNGFQATRQLTKDAETSHIPVIIVTTKTGTSGKTRVTYDGYVGVKIPNFLPDMMNPQEFYEA